MQLVFSMEELKLLAEVLLESERDAILAGEHSPKATPLLQSVLERDLEFGIDELEDLEELLKVCAAKWKKQRDEGLGEAKESLRKRYELLSRVKDRVTEACAMA